MAHLDYSERFDRGYADAFFSALVHLTKDWLAARARRHVKIARQRLDRKAFQSLLGKEDWVYKDMGIHREDVEHLSKQPLHVNAAQELEQIRKSSLMGR